MYLAFEKIRWRQDLDHIQEEIKKWADRQEVRYTTKFIKGVLRVGFDKESDFTLFTMTWVPDLEKYPHLNYQLVNIQNERY